MFTQQGTIFLPSFKSVFAPGALRSLLGHFETYVRKGIDVPNGQSDLILQNGRARSLYLDLMIKILANTIYEDPRMDPGSTDTFDLDLRETGQDWPRNAHSMAGLVRLQNVRQLTELTLKEQVPGDYIETGVWRGGCCILMKAVLEVYGDTTRRVYAADSFHGLPKPDPARFEADEGDVFHTFPQLAVSRSTVEANFGRYGLLDERVTFIEGFFEDTLPNLDAGPFALLRLDGDMYSSTIVALESLYPKLSPGGFIIIDDYGCVPACKKAVDDYRRQHRVDDAIQTIDWTGVWWRKSA